MEYFTIKNWAEYQHYKTRNPPWIKLHSSIFEDYDFDRLQDASKLHLILIWTLASKLGKKKPLIPNDPKWIQKKLHLEEPVDLNPLFFNGFLVLEKEVLAPCLQYACPEGEGEGETEQRHKNNKPFVAENKKTGDHNLNLKVSHETIPLKREFAGMEIRSMDGEPDQPLEDITENQDQDHIPDTGEKVPEEENPPQEQNSPKILSQNQESQSEQYKLGQIPEKTTNDKGKGENPVKNKSESETSLYLKLSPLYKKSYTEEKVYTKVDSSEGEVSKNSDTKSEKKKSIKRKWVDSKQSTPAGKALKAWVLGYEKKFLEAPIFNPPRDCKILDILIKTKGYDEVCDRLQKHLERGRFLNMPGFQTVYNDLGRDIQLQKKGKTRSILDKIKSVSQEIQDEQKLLGEGE